MKAEEKCEDRRLVPGAETLRTMAVREVLIWWHVNQVVMLATSSVSMTEKVSFSEFPRTG